jgi:hypothetical protein
MNNEELYFHLDNIAHHLYQRLEETGRFNRHSNPVLPAILEEIYKPLVKRMQDEHNAEMKLALEKIRQLEVEVVAARDESAYRVAGEVNGKILYARKDGIDG